MAVRKVDQKPERQKFRLETMAIKLHTSTSNRVQNMIPDNQVQAMSLRRIIYLSKDIYHRIRLANKCKIGDSDRILNQNLAHKDCERLFTEIQLSKPLFHVRARKIEAWSREISELEEGIKNWKESDVKRQKEKR